MKLPPSPVLPALALLALAASSPAQKATPDFDPLGQHDNLPRQIRIQVEFIDVSHEKLTELTLGNKTSANDAELRETVGEMVKKGEAKIIETMMCVTRSGQKASTESVREFIYPTEYEPAEIPNKVVTEKDGERSEALAPELATGPTPTAFETRNLGSTLEIEPTVGVDNRIIDLRFAPEIVYHVGNETWSEWKDDRGDSSIRMPTMYSLRINTGITLVAGEHHLVAALSPKDDKGFPDHSRKWMAFVKADVLTVGR